jgi:hypothetical protein
MIDRQARLLARLGSSGRHLGAALRHTEPFIEDLRQFGDGRADHTENPGQIPHVFRRNGLVSIFCDAIEDDHIVRGRQSLGSGQLLT